MLTFFVRWNLDFEIRNFLKVYFLLQTVLLEKRKGKKITNPELKKKTMGKEMTLKRIISAFLFILLQFLDFVHCSN